MAFIDDGIDDDSSETFAISEELVSARDPKSPGTSTLEFDGLLQPPLLIHEDVKEGCGGQLWPAGMILAKYLLRKPQLDLLRGKKMFVCGLRRAKGAGGGLVGLAIALALSGNDSSLKSFDKAPVDMVLTDQVPLLPLIHRNIDLNRLSDKGVTAAVLDWGTKEGSELHLADVVLAADCVYFEPAFPLLLQTLNDYLGPRTVCFFCFKKRRRADFRFMKACRKMFMVEEVMDDPDRERWSMENLHMYKITKKV